MSMENIHEEREMTRILQTDWSKIPAIKIGQHIRLSPAQISMYQTESGFFSDIKAKTSVELVKFFDNAMVNAIIDRARANGITDLFVLNEDFILSAIREKMGRDANKESIIDREAWEPCEWCGEWIGGDCRPKEQDVGYKLYAGYCKQVAADDFYEDETEELNYCPICGRPMTPEAWAELEKRLRGERYEKMP